MKKSLLIIFIFSSFCAVAQNLRINVEFDQLILKNKDGEKLDTLNLRYGAKSFWTYKFDTKNKKVKLYNAMNATIPDNCGNYYLFQKTFSYASGKFVMESKYALEFDNSECGSFFYEENMYCISLEGFKIKGDKLSLTIEDSQERKTAITTGIDIFSKASTLKKFKNELNKFLLKPKCISVNRVKE